jgi:hypothetical protein
MAGDDEEDFRREYEVNSHRSHLSGYVLIAGLVLELVNAIVWYEGQKRWPTWQPCC